jgi:hypothetical protein
MRQPRWPVHDRTMTLLKPRKALWIAVAILSSVFVAAPAARAEGECTQYTQNGWICGLRSVHVKAGSDWFYFGVNSRTTIDTGSGAPQRMVHAALRLTTTRSDVVVEPRHFVFEYTYNKDGMGFIPWTNLPFFRSSALWAHWDLPVKNGASAVTFSVRMRTDIATRTGGYWLDLFALPYDAGNRGPTASAPFYVDR